MNSWLGDFIRNKRSRPQPVRRGLMPMSQSSKSGCFICRDLKKSPHKTKYFAISVYDSQTPLLSFKITPLEHKSFQEELSDEEKKELNALLSQMYSLMRKRFFDFKEPFSHMSTNYNQSPESSNFHLTINVRPGFSRGELITLKVDSPAGREEIGYQIPFLERNSDETASLKDRKKIADQLRLVVDEAISQIK